MVPDSRLWIPSPYTLELIQQESLTYSVVFEEWIELCCQREYILPPSYSRILLLAEYIRVSNESQGYLKSIQVTALIPDEPSIPPTTNTSFLQSGAYSMNLAVLFQDQSRLWMQPFSQFGHTPGRVDEDLQTIFLSTLALGSPYRYFQEEEWSSYRTTELRMLEGTQKLCYQMNGHWPSHPLSDYNIRTPGHLVCSKVKIEDRRREWIDPFNQLITHGMCRRV